MKNKKEKLIEFVSHKKEKIMEILKMTIFEK